MTALSLPIDKNKEYFRSALTSSKDIEDLLSIIAQERPKAHTGFGDNTESLFVGHSYKDMKTKKLIKKTNGFHVQKSGELY